MKLAKVFISAALILSAATAAFAADTPITPSRAKVEFFVKHRLLGVVPGYFGEFEGVASVSGENVTTLKGKIKTASVNTENTKRDDHLRNEDYFDAPKYPEITFNSTASAAGTITGDLTIHGVTKSVTLKISRDRDAFVLEGQIDRTHFGVGKGLGTSVQIADEVNIKLWFRPQV